MERRRLTRKGNLIFLDFIMIIIYRYYNYNNNNYYYYYYYLYNGAKLERISMRDLWERLIIEEWEVLKMQ